METTVIQLSDFHIKTTMPSPEKNTVFSRLVKFLKAGGFKNIVLLYNGDIIDSKCLRDIIAHIPEAERVAAWDKAAAKAFEKAKQYFRYFMQELEISNKNVIFCIGNHDINQFVERTGKRTCAEGKSLYEERRYALIDQFIKDFTYIPNPHQNYFKQIDNLNFLVINSNWSNKDEGKLCFDCDSISTLLLTHRDTLTETKERFSKQHNILAAHAPRTDFCEFGLYPYSENKGTGTAEMLDSIFGLQLYGDKHTNNVHYYDYIVGAPLESDIITGGLHLFTEEGQYIHKTLLYKDNSWKIAGSNADIEDILNISKIFLKPRALRNLFGTDDVPDLVDKIRYFEAERSKTQWYQLDKLFRACATIQKPKDGMAGSEIRAEDSFIKTLSWLIAESQKFVSVIIRGEARLGKSLFMSLLYLNLLYSFSSGTFDDIPIYVNIEDMVRRISEKIPNRDTNRFLKKVESEFISLLEKSEELAHRYNCRLCCLIDGLNQQVFYENSRIERMISKILKSKAQNIYGHVIYCLDTDRDLSLEFTPQHTSRVADYLVYFNRINTYKVDSTKKFEEFLNAFCLLNHYTLDDAKQIADNIHRLQVLEIDLNILVVLGEKLRHRSISPFFNLLDEFVREKLTDDEIEKAAKLSYYLYMSGKNYTWIQRKTKLADNSLFELVRTQKLVSKYLLAMNYVLSARSGKLTDNDFVVLNYLYGHEICSYIQGYILKMNLQSEFFSFARLKYSELSYDGKSTASYLIGRLYSDRQSLNELLDEEERELLKTSVSTRDLYAFCVAKRSIRLSRIVNAVSEQQYTLVDDYIRLLLSNQHERKINRDFYLQFYGDRKKEELNVRQDIIYEGIDIYNTYQFLATRLKDWCKTRRNYPLLCLELFTLCDLVQVRIDTPTAVRRISLEICQSCFYNEKYLKDTTKILDTLLEIISTYIADKQALRTRTLFSQYLIQQRGLFERCKETLHKGIVLDGNSAPFNPRQLLADLRSLEKKKKTGWCITERIDSLSKEKYSQICQVGAIHETVLEHIFEAYLIGLLYLPSKSSSNESYDKQKILNIIMVHDIGEAYTGDYPPSYIDYKEKKEEESRYCEKIFLSGIHNKSADLLEYFQIWLDWYNWCDQTATSEYNITVARDIDRLQMLYKLLTLLHNKSIKLSKARFADFWGAVDTIRSNEVKEIFNIIIADDPVFRETAKTYDIELCRIKY